jgi:hypothetical protein
MQISFLASILATVRAVLSEKQAEPILDHVA